MALQTQDIELSTGETGNYFIITYFRWDKATRKASAHLSMYKSQEIRRRVRSSPIVPIAAKVRLEGAKFDQYFSNEALQNSDHIKQLYLAVKNEPSCVVSGIGQANVPIFDGAQDV